MGEIPSGRPEDPASTEPPAPVFSERLLAGCEVLLVALVGDLLVVPVALGIGGIAVSQVFQDALVLNSLLALKATATLGIVIVLLKARGEGLRNLGWARLKPRGEILRGLSSVPFLFLLVALTGLAFEIFLPELVSDTNPMLDLVQEPGDILLFVISSLYVGGLQEEIQRAFILHRFEKYLGGCVVGLVVWSAFFGVGHAVQGVDNAVKAALLGLLFGLLYLKRRDLTSPVTAHSIYNVTTVLIYWFWLRS